jgi:hypothetical protein
MSSPGLLSLQAFTVQLDAEVKRAQRYGRSLSIAVIALDGLRELGVQTASGAREAVLGAPGGSLRRRRSPSSRRTRTPKRYLIALGARSSRCAPREATGSPSRRRRRSAPARRPGGLGVERS